MQVATKLSLLCAGVVLLLTSPVASQEQCTIPTDQDVKEVANQIYETLTLEGDSPNTVQDVLEVHFTCLATVALDMYASATVVSNFTINNSSGSIVDQFQLVCDNSTWEKSSLSGFETTSGNLPSMPFDIATQNRCSRCELVTSPLANYDPDSNCICEYACVCVNVWKNGGEHEHSLSVHSLCFYMSKRWRRILHW